jgi:dephospho-CoA kinase
VASYVVDNSGTLEDLRDQVTEVFAALTDRAGGSGR